MDTYGYVLVYMELIWVFMGKYRYIGVNMGIYGYIWVYMGIYGYI